MSKMIFRIVLLTVILIVVGYFVASPIFTNSEVKDKIEQLYSAKSKSNEKINFKTPEFLALPPIISNYLKSVIITKNLPRQVCSIKLVGQTRDDRYSEWKATSVNFHYSLTQPAYVWDGTTEAFKFLWSRSIHSLFENKAESQTKFLSSIITEEVEGVKLDHSSFLFYLLHSVFNPTVLLPNQDTQWKALSNRAAEVVLWHKSVSGKVIFYLNESGIVDKVVAEDMFAPNTIEDQKTTFTIQVANYTIFDGIKIPTYLEYEWLLSDGKITIGRFNISNVEYKQ